MNLSHTKQSVFVFRLLLCIVFKMGWFSSDEQKIDETLVESTGHVNTNVIIQEANDTHTQALLSEKLLVATYVLVALETIKLGICCYNMWKRQIKKKYNNNNRPPQNP